MSDGIRLYPFQIGGMNGPWIVDTTNTTNGFKINAIFYGCPQESDICKPIISSREIELTVIKRNKNAN